MSDGAGANRACMTVMLPAQKGQKARRIMGDGIQPCSRLSQMGISRAPKVAYSFFSSTNLVSFGLSAIGRSLLAKSQLFK